MKAEIQIKPKSSPESLPKPKPETTKPSPESLEAEPQRKPQPGSRSQPGEPACWGARSTGHSLWGAPGAPIGGSLQAPEGEEKRVMKPCLGKNPRKS